MSRRPFIAGNWKMNVVANPEAAVDMIAGSIDSVARDMPAVVICPPATLISRLCGRGVRIGGQDCHFAPKGAHTGDLSAEMLVAVGASHVILGHSERRAAYRETDALVAAKVKAAWKAELTTIICVGETQEQRDAGQALATVEAQVASLPAGVTTSNTVIAYEPVWAIGSGRAAEIAEIAEMHAAIRDVIRKKLGDAIADSMRIIYGGSVNDKNAASIFALEDVDGGLIGGASLVAGDFVNIMRGFNL